MSGRAPDPSMSSTRPQPTELHVVPSGQSPVVTMLDAHAPWTDRARAILDRDGIATTVGGGEPVERLRPAPDVLLLSERSGPSTVVEAIPRIRRHLSGAAIVVAVSALTEQPLGGLVAAGVDGLVLEAELETHLALVVRCVLAGQITMPRRARHTMEPPALTHREKQILALVIAGQTNLEIARRLCLGESTVKTHLSSAFRRLGISSRREAAAAVLNGDERLRQSVLMTLRDTPGT